ncbi:hypothetical protein XELAEV_18003920mg [Xenopus laevis]|uniref:Uncharacterized protein n=1 Tax=Xenopus laevis TaxID=8355 RepID=A0A974BNP8_XENLA|nr:hypothetical protein XELAEV_18003920mg [Xenopus laevis]
MGNHRSSLRAAFETGRSDIALYKHYLEKGHGPPTFRFMGIDIVTKPRRGGDWNKLLLQRETFWIQTLNTVSPRGLNEYCSFVSFLNSR